MIRAEAVGEGLVFWGLGKYEQQKRWTRAGSKGTVAFERKAADDDVLESVGTGRVEVGKCSKLVAWQIVGREECLDRGVKDVSGWIE